MQIINLTPHAVIIIECGQVYRQYEPSGKVAKLEESDDPIDKVDGVNVVRKVYGDVVITDRDSFLLKTSSAFKESFPAEQEGIAYIVPMLVGQQMANQRKDVYGPDFGIGGVRAADGKIAGDVGFIKY